MGSQDSWWTVPLASLVIVVSAFWFYDADRQTHTHTHTRTDTEERFTPVTLVGVSDDDDNDDGGADCIQVSSDDDITLINLMDHHDHDDDDGDCIQVSCEERLYALSETGCDVDNAIKLLLLRQLMSSCNEDADRCKEALMSASWDVRLATWNLGPRPREPDSPEIVHV